MGKGIELLAWIGIRMGKAPGWERVVRLFASPEKCRSMRDICVLRDGVMFMAQPSVPLGWNIAFFGTYEPELREVFKTVLSPGCVAIDVGANVGWHTLLLAHLVGPAGRVIAAEANPRVRDRLMDNLQLNRFDHVEVAPFAIGDAEGVVQFHGPAAEAPDAGDGHVMAPGEAARDGTVQVATRRLDEICSTAGIERLDLVKVDVEGFEWPVFHGGEETIARFRPHIVFEYVEEYAFRGGGTPAMFDAFFRKHRYRLFLVGRNWWDALDANRWPKAGEIWAIPAK